MIRIYMFAIGVALCAAAIPIPFAAEVSGALVAQVQQRGIVRVIVRLKVARDDDAPDGAQAAAIASAQQNVLGSISLPDNARVKVGFEFPWMAMEVNEEALKALSTHPLVQAIDLDVTDPVNEDLDAPTLSSSVPVIGAEVAQSYGIRGSGTTVAILDTGVQKTHPFLSGKVVSEACYSSTVSADGATTICPGGVQSSTATGSGVNCSLTIDSGCAHGTHVAGIAAGKGGGSTGVTFSGVAPEARVIAIQVFSRFDGAVAYSNCGYSPCVLSYISDQMLGLEQVYNLRSTYRIAAANMSLGGGRNFTYCDSDPRKPIIDSLRAAGIATVISSGNSSYRDSVGAPGCISSAVTVGATDDGDNVASFSNIDDTVDLLAPGVSITSSVPTTSGSGYATKNGTSMSAPHVTGAFALFTQLDPLANVSEKQSRLASLAVQVDDNRTGGIQSDMDRVAVAWMGNDRCYVTGKIANRWAYTSSTPYSYVSVTPESDYGTGYSYYARVANGTSVASMADMAKRRTGNLGHKPTVTIRGTGPCPTSGTLRYIYSADFGYLTNER